MKTGAPLILYVLLVTGIAGLLLIVVASTNAPLPRDPRDSASSPCENPITTGPSGSVSARRAEQPPEASPTTAADAATTVVPTISPTGTSTPRPRPTPIAISPPCVSSTGALAYVETGALIVIAPNEFTPMTVAEGVSHDAGAVLWSPDGRRLLYASETESASGGQAFHVWDSQLERTLHLKSRFPDFPWHTSRLPNAIWSPKGTRILFQFSSGTRSHGAWVVDVNAPWARSLPNLGVNTAAWIDENTVLHRRSEGGGSQLISVASPARAITRTVALPGSYALSPTRDRVASFKGEPGAGQRLHVSSLWDDVSISLSHQPTVTASVHDLLWSPDGRWVAYGGDAIAARGGSGPITLLADTWGVAATQTISGLLPVAWSADSRLLAGFGCIDMTCSLSLIDAPSGQVVSIASGRYLRLWDLAWSPRGVYLLYSTSGSDANTDVDGLTLWSRATGERFPLVSGSETRPLTDLQWAADGCSLYAAQRREEGADLVPAVIWGVGPSWEERWYVAPGSSESSPSLIQVLRQREDSRGTGLCAGALLDSRRLIAYYGTPQGPGLGILGRYSMTETLRLLNEQTQAYRVLDPAVDTIPAFHMVTTIADDYAGADLDFNHRVSPETVRRWIDTIEAAGGWSILDIQPGRAALADELNAIEPLLLEPHVHLAVDPEFIVGEGEVPGHDLGRITGTQINWLQARLDRVARSTGRRKLLIIHQFNDRMIQDKEVILDYPLVDLVWDADGFGSAGAKTEDYDQYRAEPGFEYGAFKLFYEYDEPLMTPGNVLWLTPSPRVVIYQ